MTTTYENYGVQAVVDIYPYEGGKYTLSSSNGYMLSVSTSKNLSDSGTFGITLSSGGVTGNSSQTWTQIVTPLSLVVIAMMRGSYKQIVMLGVVTSVSESQQWGQGAQRQITVSGMDLTYFFVQTNYYNLTFLYGSALAELGGVGMLGASDNGLIGGLTPAAVGQKWYTDIMAGSQGILSTTQINYKGEKVAFKNIFGTLFQEIDTAVDIPFSANYLADQGSWMGKFQSFFQYPWYEFFINTAVAGTYGETQASNSVPSSSGLFTAATAVVVARVNPLPRLTNSGTLASPTWSVDLTNWNALNSTVLDTGFFSSSVTFVASDARNFYMINPITVAQMLGASNADISPFLMTQVLWKDQGSVNRYGYLPQTIETQWFLDPSGISARQNASNTTDSNPITTLYNDLMTRVMGFIHPLPLMASATVSIPLRPDIMIGEKFSYVPFKDNVTWVFYIEAVSHSFPFGGQPSTTLTLSRGLPESVYNSPSLLTAVFTGTAYKQNGTYTAASSSDTSYPGLTAVTMANAGSQSTGFATAQGGQQPGSSS